MDSPPPDLCLSQPIPTSPTAVGNVLNPRHLTSPLQNPKKKRTKVHCFQIQRDGEASSSSTAVVRPKPAARKPDPFAPKITMPCSECGKKFWSWKALYGHMRCHPDRQWRGIHPPPIQPSPLTPQDYEAASCLLLLANSPASEELAMVVAAEGGHRCGICWKVFSSGQALGGHKRCHWDKPTTAYCITPGGGDFDLNMPAAEDPMEHHNDLQLVLRLGIGDSSTNLT